MSNVNNYVFAKHLDQFKIRVLDAQIKRVSEAKVIMEDKNYVWKEGQKEIADAKYKSYLEWLAFYQEFYNQGMIFVRQHEGIVDKLSKWYDKWYQDISNEGKQEVEMMSIQADMLNEIFCEMYKELLPLNLEGMKSPKALNLK